MKNCDSSCNSEKEVGKTSAFSVEKNLEKNPTGVEIPNSNNNIVKRLNVCVLGPS